MPWPGSAGCPTRLGLPFWPSKNSTHCHGVASQFGTFLALKATKIVAKISKNGCCELNFMKILFYLFAHWLRATKTALVSCDAMKQAEHERQAAPGVGGCRLCENWLTSWWCSSMPGWRRTWPVPGNSPETARCCWSNSHRLPASSSVCRTVPSASRASCRRHP